MATVAIPTPECKTLTYDLYGTPAAPSAPEPTQAAPLPEAAFSLTLKGTIGGVDALLTVRGQTIAAFAANVAAVRGMLDTPQAPPAAPAPPPAAATQDGWCAMHQVAMPLQTNARGSWRSHKTAEGTWCKGR